MKHPDLLKLKYDGQVEINFKKYKKPAQRLYEITIDKLAKKILAQYPKEKGINFVQLAKIGYELQYKRERDKAIITNGISPLEEFKGVKDFIQYLKVLGYCRYTTQTIKIKYLNPLIPSKNGSVESFKKIEDLDDWVIKEILIEGRQLNGLIESALSDRIPLEPLKEINESMGRKLTTYGALKNRPERFNAQYSKAACTEIYNCLKLVGSEEETRKSITVFTLESVGLIPSYDNYVSNCVEAGKKPVSRATHESRAFRSLMK